LDEATKEAFDAEGWFRTGDIGYLDEEGYLYICDRKKDMIITGGENVYPAEVEGVLLTHPAISEVAVIGLPDDKWGERVTAVIALSHNAALSIEDLDIFLSDRLARFKQPRTLRFVDALPRNPAGKVQKFALREMLLAPLD
jgi:fatty-acyl-CoA synthase